MKPFIANIHGEPFRTALIGCGKIALGYAEDSLFKKEFKYAVHAEGLKAHPDFNWEAAADPDDNALNAARRKWGIKNCYKNASELLEDYSPEVVVIATKPEVRSEIITSAKSLKAVLCEKPLGLTFEEAKAFVRLCKDKNILLQVAYLRRGDEFLNSLRNGGLEKMIGKTQFVNAGYGNGISNNGCHVVDLLRMLLGEVSEIKLISTKAVDSHCPLEEDFSYPFHLKMGSGVPVSVQAFDFSYYREIFWDFWGTCGRLTISQEGLMNQKFEIAGHRALTGVKECRSDKGRIIKHTHGTALYNLYHNLSESLAGKAKLCSSGENALATEAVINELKKQISGKL